MKRTPALFNNKDLVADLQCIYDDEVCATNKDGQQLGYVCGTPVQTYIQKDSHLVEVNFLCLGITEAQGKLQKIIQYLYEVYEERNLEIEYEWFRHGSRAILYFYFTESNE